MSTKPSNGQERTDTNTDLAPRDVRALTEHMSILGRLGRAKDADGLYLVVSQSGSEYLVDVLGGACECPDNEYTDNHCKHLRAVEFATGRRVIPAWADREAINNTLGDHVDETPVFASEIVGDPEPELEPTQRVATDGGTKAVVEGEGEAPPAYTVHVEPADQGGKEYARCTGCDREFCRSDASRTSNTPTAVRTPRSSGE